MLDIVVTGSSSSIAKNFIERVRCLGHNIITIKLRSETDLHQLYDLKKLDVFVHCGALTPKNFDSNSMTEKDYYRSNTHILSAISKLVKRKSAFLIYLSTADVYPRFGGPFFESQESTSQEQILGSHYGWSKYQAEGMIKEILSNYCILRVPTIFEFNAPLKAFPGKILASPNDDEAYEPWRFDFFYNFITCCQLGAVIESLVVNNYAHLSETINVTTDSWVSFPEILDSVHGINYKPVIDFYRNDRPLKTRFNGANNKLKKLLNLTDFPNLYTRCCKIK